MMYVQHRSEQRVALSQCTVCINDAKGKNSVTLVKDGEAAATGADAAKGFCTGGGAGSTCNAAWASRNLLPRSRRAAGGTVTQRRHQGGPPNRTRAEGWSGVGQTSPGAVEDEDAERAEGGGSGSCDNWILRGWADGPKTNVWSSKGSLSVQ